MPKQLILLFFIFLFKSSIGLSLHSSHLESKILKLEQKIEQTQINMASNQINIEKLEQKIKDLSHSIRQFKASFRNRLFTFSYVNKLSWLLALNSQSKTIFDRNFKILKKINENDINSIYEFKIQLSELKESYTQIQTENSRLKDYLKELKIQKDDLKKLETLEIQRLTQLNRFDHLLKLKGYLALPTELRIKQKYGKYFDQGNQYLLLVKGLVFDAFEKTAIRSFGPGQVIFRDEIAYWGESLIVQHEGDYFTVYSAVENSNLKVGDLVLNQQILGYTKGPDFYFELRHKQTSINPLEWIKQEKGSNAEHSIDY